MSTSAATMTAMNSSPMLQLEKQRSSAHMSLVTLSGLHLKPQMHAHRVNSPSGMKQQMPSSDKCTLCDVGVRMLRMMEESQTTCSVVLRSDRCRDKCEDAKCAKYDGSNQRSLHLG